MDQASTGVAERDRTIVDVAAVRPRLRHDVVFAESTEGVFLRHSDNGFVLKGRSAYRLVSSLTPHLTGEHSVEELCAGLGDAQTAMVTATIRTLLDRGFVRDRGREPDVVLAPAVKARFQRQISLVEHYVDGAVGRFAAFRQTRVLLIGRGEVVDAAALALLRNGLLRVHRTMAGDPRVDAEAVAMTEAGTPAEVVTRADAHPSEFDVVVIAAGDSVGAGQVAALVREVRAGGSDVALLPVVVVGRAAVLGPLVRAGQEGCWFCAMLRLGGSVDGPQAAELWRGLMMPMSPATRSVSGPAAALIGNALAFDVFRLRTGCLAAETERSVLSCDLDTIESRRGVLLRHPLCSDCTTAPGDPPLVVQAEDLVPALPPDTDAFGADPYTVLVDDRIGLLGGYSDGSLPQSPVRVGRVKLLDPTGVGAPARHLTGFDLDTTLSGRDRAVRAALVAYVDTLGRHPATRSGSAADLTTAGHDPVDPASLQTWLGVTTRPDRWVPATVLGTGSVRLVPAGAVYPTMGPANVVAFEPTPVGGAAGWTTGGAVLDGLLSALTYQALRTAADGAPVAPSVVDDSDVEMLTRAADLLGRPVTVVDLPAGGTGAVSLAVTRDEQPPIWRVGSGLTRRDATVAALRDLVGTLRLAGDGVDADLGTPLLAGFDPRTLRVEAHGPDAPPSVVDGAELVDRLGASGWNVLVVDTTTPELRDVGLTTVRVLLARGPVAPDGGESLPSTG